MLFESLQVKADKLDVSTSARHIGFRTVTILPLQCLGTPKMEMRSEGGVCE